MAEKQNTPEIRFEGFTDPWEQRKLGELGSVAMCKRIFKEQTTEQGDVPFYKIGTFGGTPDAFISRELFDEYQRLYQFPKVGDILISAAGTIGRTIVYQGDPAYYQDSNIVWLQHDERLDNGFLLQFLDGKNWSSLEGSTLKRLYNKDLLNTEITIPSPDEQHQIGSTFARLDDIITLHQRKYDKLCTVKKSMLDKMFPKPGETEPEIRFEGFTDPWEQRKLGELCELNPTAVLPDSFEYVDLESVAGTDMISHRREEKLTAPSRAQRLASFGDIFYQTVRPYQKNNYFYELPDEDYVFSTGYAQLRPLCDGRFLFSSLQRDQFVSCVLEHCTGTSYPAINANDLAALFLAVPIDAEEQRLVGSILKPIDSLITLHQRKLELLRNIKKSLLDRMFV